MSSRSARSDMTITALIPELDALVAEAMAEWQVPAVTLAVVGLILVSNLRAAEPPGHVIAATT